MRRGEFFKGLVMVCDDHIKAFFDGGLHLGDVRDSTVDSDEKPSSLSDQRLDGFPVEAVSLGEPVRDIPFNRPAQ